jgi:hypothetical protein
LTFVVSFIWPYSSQFTIAEERAVRSSQKAQQSVQEVKGVSRQVVEEGRVTNFCIIRIVSTLFGLKGEIPIASKLDMMFFFMKAEF